MSKLSLLEGSRTETIERTERIEKICDALLGLESTFDGGFVLLTDSDGSLIVDPTFFN